jgi:hypothetical protein
VGEWQSVGGTNQNEIVRGGKPIGPLGRAQASRGLGGERRCGHLDAAEVHEALGLLRQLRSARTSMR